MMEVKFIGYVVFIVLLTCGEIDDWNGIYGRLWCDRTLTECWISVEVEGSESGTIMFVAVTLSTGGVMKVGFWIEWGEGSALLILCNRTSDSLSLSVLMDGSREKESCVFTVIGVWPAVPP